MEYARRDDDVCLLKLGYKKHCCFLLDLCGVTGCEGGQLPCREDTSVARGQRYLGGRSSGPSVGPSETTGWWYPDYNLLRHWEPESPS